MPATLADYHARRYRTLYAPDALNFTPRTRVSQARVYSPLFELGSGLPRAARNLRTPALIPSVLLVATSLGTYLGLKEIARSDWSAWNKSAGSPEFMEDWYLSLYV